METIQKKPRQFYNLRQEAMAFSEAVKHRIHKYDPQAKIILSGSRVRGDAEADSDWEFLVCGL